MHFSKVESTKWHNSLSHISLRTVHTPNGISNANIYHIHVPFNYFLIYQITATIHVDYLKFSISP